MASLLEEKAVVRALDKDFHKNSTITMAETRIKRLKESSDGTIDDADFLGYIRMHPVLLREKIKSWFSQNWIGDEAKIIARRHKVGRIYEDCLKDGYIEKIYENPIVIPAEGYKGIRPSGKSGKDLTHWMGFFEAFFTKYPLSWSFALKIFLSLTSGGIGAYILIELAKRLIFHQLY